MAGLLAAPKRRRPQFHRLTVSRIDRLTDDAVAISLAIPPDLTDTFSFAAGQYLTLRADLDGQQVRRSYSICLSPAAAARRAELRVAAARVERGVMSTWLNERVRVGDDIDVLPPMGEFVIAPAPPGAPGRHHVAIAAGSGITPVLSLLMAALEAGDDATLIFGNRRESSIMFADELAELARDNPDSLRVIHVFSQEAGADPLLSGRLDAGRIRAIVEERVPTRDGRDEWYLCGPSGLVDSARAALADLQVAPERVHQEIFHVDGPQA